MKVEDFIRDTKIIILLLFLAGSFTLIFSKGLVMGLDLQGGTRIIVELKEKPENKTMTQVREEAIDVLKIRLNALGIGDITPKPWGDRFILIDAAIRGKNESQMRKEAETILGILQETGVFEAKIGNKTVFTGEDIVQVFPPRVSQIQTAGGTSFRWEVPFALSSEGARRFANLTKDMESYYDQSEGKRYLVKPLDMYLDKSLESSPRISADLAGRIEQRVEISGVNASHRFALKEAERIKSILTSGRLPVEIEIVQKKSVSPRLGEGFIEASRIMGLLAVFVVAAIVFGRYKEKKIVVPIIVTCISEVVIILGFASFIRWNLDLASIGGIIAAVGTGVDHQIVITDEVLRGETRRTAYGIKKGIDMAFFIILAAAATTIVAMIPLFRIIDVRGFALTTIVGVFVGVFVTRPAYARIIAILLKE
ncbi:MAG: preprotein translocase subunit SecD [Candidatus Hydrothermarchaeota archaeon]